MLAAFRRFSRIVLPPGLSLSPAFTIVIVDATVNVREETSS
jgi:hypothetical protein